MTYPLITSRDFTKEDMNLFRFLTDPDKYFDYDMSDISPQRLANLEANGHLKGVKYGPSMVYTLTKTGREAFHMASDNTIWGKMWRWNERSIAKKKLRESKRQKTKLLIGFGIR